MYYVYTVENGAAIRGAGVWKGWSVSERWKRMEAGGLKRGWVVEVGVRLCKNGERSEQVAEN